MEHAVHVKGLLAGEEGDHYVQKQREDHQEEVELKGVDRAADGVHPPDDEGAEGLGEDGEQFVAEVNQMRLGDEGVVDIRPVALDDDVEDADDHAGELGGPGSSRSPLLPVEAEDHHRAASAQPDGAGEHHVHPDVVHLGHVVGADGEDASDDDCHDANHADVCLGSEAALLQWQHHILRHGEGGTEYLGVIRGEHCQHQKEAECAEHSLREQMAHGFGDAHLSEEGAALLEEVVGLAGRINLRLFVLGGACRRIFQKALVHMGEELGV